MKNIILNFFKFLNLTYPKKLNQIIFLSSPDFSDNSFATFKYLIENATIGYKYIWLVDEIENKNLYFNMIKNNIDIEDNELCKIKIIDKKSFCGLLNYINSRYIFFTHGFYAGMSLPKSQVRINLWHGMPLKTIGYLDTANQSMDIQKCTYTIATSKRFQKIMSDAFLLKSNSVLTTGQPRCDFLFNQSGCLTTLGIKKEQYKKIIFWAPTYRNTEDGKMQDGDFQNHLPLLNNGELSKLNEYLLSIKSYMLIKLHPMDALNKHDFEKYSNITIIKKMDLLENSCQLYSLLSEVDILLTDFSSIYIDFLLLNKPIIFAIDDFDVYKKTRNFVFSEPKGFMPGAIVENYTELINVLDDLIVRGNDCYIDKRDKVKKEFHLHERGFSNRLIESLQL
ncbi:MAG: CDP-glycerol:poly(glycerophosphate) glycerophosphotransferase (EC [uncultured Sulfurovum sp.]|uniref:CDP-glycerol:poly(Glycerophosphate) glycerophosphotransferase (EC) n=1 Tax=uncultured Sulfurovum sp. TaxID=269237 RepID=A0A6S6T885_9BACT|nr:MAG: CDP-glycerol:poly(glycerophosphate) glycerophosphotransferase (EC [uncultured Sulfurovum sp.]